MTGQNNRNELERALCRPDADAMIRQIDAFANHHAGGDGAWPDEYAEDFAEIVTCHHDDPEKALAYVVIAASRCDDADFLCYLGCGPLEDVLRQPPADLIERVLAEARRSARFRWLLSNPFKVAVSDNAWAAIEPFRVTGPHEEAPLEMLPPREAE